MKKHTFTLLELGCAALLLFTYFFAEGNGLLLLCGIVLILDSGMRFLKERHEGEK